MKDYYEAVNAAEQTLQMYDEVISLRRQVEDLTDYKNKYMDLLNSSISHGEHMLGGMLELAMKPGVMDAIAKSNKGKP